MSNLSSQEVVDSVAKAMAEIARLRLLVRDAWHEGWNAGRRTVDDMPQDGCCYQWDESDAKKELGDA